MKFFIASPWRNKTIVEGLSEELVKRGYEVYSFLQSGSNLASGISIAEELKTFSDALHNWEADDNIKKIFDSELDGLKQSDAIILMQPAGHSSLIEAGIGYGMGKKVFMIGEIEKPEVFYLMSERIYADLDTFLSDLSVIAPLQKPLS
jgi:hypothetical protein